MEAVKPVVFFHVMKCGGTSVRAGLAQGIADDPAGPDVFELDGQIALEAAGGLHAENWRFRDSLLLYVLLADQPKLVLGHVRYRDRYTDYLDRFHFVTVLRDPVERFISLYQYRRYKEGVDVPVSGSFEDFIDKPRWQKEGHAYVEVFCGRDDLDRRSDAAVEAAVENLGRFEVVGFTDQLDRFATDVGSCVGREVHIPRLNKSPAPDDDREISAELLARTHEICAPDIALFEAMIRDRSAAQPPENSMS
ncbi:MAG: sulfotransferase family 2 domain-containing protein [Acidimicrobiia bacterium]|nr:sulfotransferase family 2 domain-containing protein [Acidimicrobiia bacterium]